MPWEKPDPERGFNLDAAVVQVRAVYPGDPFRGGEIAWLDFWFLYRGIGQTMALLRLNAALAANLGQGGEGTDHALGLLKKEAFPD